MNSVPMSPSAGVEVMTRLQLMGSSAFSTEGSGAYIGSVHRRSRTSSASIAESFEHLTSHADRTAKMSQLVNPFIGTSAVGAVVVAALPLALTTP
jgi:hypothetical protein